MLGDESMDPSSSSHPPRPSRSDVTDGAQAHYNARTHSDEYVVDLLVSLDRVKVLVHDLLAIEVRVGAQYGDVTVWLRDCCLALLLFHYFRQMDLGTSRGVFMRPPVVTRTRLSGLSERLTLPTFL